MPDDKKDEQKKSDHNNESKPVSEKPSMNLLEATGIALFKNVDESSINNPSKGELKRSLRLARLLIILGLALAGLFIFFGILAYPMAGLLKLIALLLAVLFTIRCASVALKLWKKLK